MRKRGRLPSPLNVQFTPVTPAPIVLGPLTLPLAVVAEGTAPGAVVATIAGKTPGSTITLTNDAGGRFTLSTAGETVRVLTGLVATDYAAATSHDITLRETLAGATNTPRDSTVTVTVSDVVESSPGGSSSDFGFLALRDEGTTGDYYVDPVNGNDANAGTSAGAPKRTIMSVAGSNRHIKVRAGTCREYVDMSAYTGVTLSRYGAEAAVVSGQELIAANAWGPLLSADHAFFTSAQIASGNIKRCVLPSASISGGSAKAAFLHEGTTPLVPAMMTGPSPALPMHTMDEYQWMKAATPTSTGLNNFVLPASQQGQGWTATQVLNADLHIYEGGGNFNYRVPTSAYNSSTHTVSQNTGSSGWTRSPHPWLQDLFALINFLPLLSAGQWGYRVDGSNTILYVWPTNPASITNGTISYAARSKGIRLGSNCVVRGMRTHGHATVAQYDQGAMAIDVSNTVGATVDNCHIESVWNIATTIQAGYGALYASLSDRLTVSHVHIEGAYATKGFNFTGNYPGHHTSGTLMNSSQRGERNKMVKCSCGNVEYSPILVYGQDQFAGLGFEVTAPSGTMAHSNKLEAYIQNSRCVFVGMNLNKSRGYATIQQSSGMAFLTCDMAAGHDYDGRGFGDQNYTSYPTPAQLGFGPSQNYLLSCRLPPHPDRLSGAWFPAFRKDDGASPGPWKVRSVISHGISLPGTGHVIENSIFTQGAAPAGTGNTAVALSSVYVDAAAGDYTYADGAAFRSAPRQNLAADVAVIKGWFDGSGPGGVGRIFDDEEFDIDCTGEAVSWSSAPYGPYENYGSTTPAAPAWTVDPVLSGDATEGSTLTATAGSSTGVPTPTPAHQWQESSNSGSSWSDILGATSAGYLLPVGAAGKIFRRKTTLTNGVGSPAVAFSNASGVVSAAGANVGVPLAIASFSGGDVLVSGTWRVESGNFSPNPAKGLVVVIFRTQAEVEESPSAKITRVSLGTTGRASGAGNALDLHVPETAWGEEFVVASLPPGFSSGSQTILVECSADGVNYTGLVYEVDNFSGLIGATVQTSNGGNGSTITINTLHAGSRVLYVVQKQNGLPANAISVSGASELYNYQTTSGGSAGDDSQVYVGHEAAATAGSYSATWTTPSGLVGVYLHAAVELRKA